MTCTRARTNFYFSVAVSASSVKNNFIKAELKMLLFIRFSFEINTFSLLPSSEFNFSRTSLINIPGGWWLKITPRTPSPFSYSPHTPLTIYPSSSPHSSRFCWIIIEFWQFTPHPCIICKYL